MDITLIQPVFAKWVVLSLYLSLSPLVLSVSLQEPRKEESETGHCEHTQINGVCLCSVVPSR